jgi:hypothetical protein
MADCLSFIREKSTRGDGGEKTDFLPQEALERLQALGYIDEDYTEGD